MPLPFSPSLPSSSPLLLSGALANSKMKARGQSSFKPVKPLPEPELPVDDDDPLMDDLFATESTVSNDMFAAEAMT